MRNSQLFIGAIVLGVLALMLGIIYVANIALGYHPTRGYIVLAAGVILLIIGIVGMVSTSRGRI